MKKLSLVFTLVSASVLLLSCSSQKTAEKAETVQPVENKTPLVQINIPAPTAPKAEEPKESVYKDISEVRDPVIKTSAELKDTTDIGFNYSGKNVADNDFSTSWCGTKKGIGDWISYTFKDPVEAKKLGVLPGYGRDENIYFGNNRIKELKAIFTDLDGRTTEKTFDFPDKYQMDFVDLGDVKFKSVKFVVNDVYAVTNDPDTCIAELDFWSDYVKNEDAGAAMNYYNKYKADKALRPKNIVSEVLISNNAPNKCGTPVKASSDFVDRSGVSQNQYGMSLNLGSKVYASAVINGFGRVGDKLTANWYGESTAGEEFSMGSRPNEEKVDSNLDVPVVADCNGELYVNVTSDKSFWGANRIEFFNGAESVGSAKFFMAQ